MDPWLCIVMPVHFGADYIGSALASVASEGAEGVEVRLYNSADDDGAARDIAEGFRDRLSIIWQEKPAIKPWTSKTNLGVAETKAPYIAMLHQDDFWLPGHLAAIRLAISQTPDAVLAIGPSRFAAANGRMLGEWRLPLAPGLHDGGELIEALLVQNSIAIPSPVIRRDAWLACAGLEEALWYTADWDLYLKLAKAGRIAVRPDATTAFRLHGASLTMAGRDNLGEFRQQMEQVLERHLQDFPDATPSLNARARASIDVNCALAAASAGNLKLVPETLLSLAQLGPGNLARYLSQSRLVDRVRPRLRLKFSGGF